MKMSVLTGGDDPYYAIPLLSAIVDQDIVVEFIGNDDMEKYEIMKDRHVIYFNLRGNQDQKATMRSKMARVIRYYCKLITYCFRTQSNVFHILWLNKFVHFDRTLLNAYYKLMGKKIILTAHNINEKARDGNDNRFNRWTLKVMYRIVDHIIVHTMKMKSELVDSFGVEPEKITVMKFGVNEVILVSDLTCIEAKRKLGLSGFRILLFFGQIAPYKGLEYLVRALGKLKEGNKNIRLVIAGKIKRGYEEYWHEIDDMIVTLKLDTCVMKKIEYIPDDEIEVYFKAADVLIQPYKYIFQSGPLFLAYKFGLPVIATDVGEFRDDIIEGKTGLVCKPGDVDDLAQKILVYFESELYKELPAKRGEIVNYSKEKYSWKENGVILKDIYQKML